MARDTSTAPKAFLYHSSVLAALSIDSTGVTVWCPSGTACFALVTFPSFKRVAVSQREVRAPCKADARFAAIGRKSSRATEFLQKSGRRARRQPFTFAT